MKSLRICIPILSLLGLFTGAIAGVILWHKGYVVPPERGLTWVWFFGGFASFAGGITLISRSRGLALLCVLGGFVVFWTASLYLHGASRFYEELKHPAIF